MLRNLILLLFILNAYGLKSQNDLSKKQLLETLETEIPDSTRIDFYNELCWPIYSYDNTDSSLYYGNKALDLAIKSNDLKRLSIAHRRVGITYTNVGDIKNGIHHQEESYKISEQINFKRGMQLALNNIGVAYLNNELLEKALTYFLGSLKIAEQIHEKASLPSLYYNIGVIYNRTNDLNKSKDFFRKANYYAHLNDNSELVIISYCNLSTVCRNAGQIDSSKYYLSEAKKLLTDKTGINTKYNYYLNEGLLFSWSGNHEKSLESFLAMKKLASVVSDQITLQINIAEEYAKLNKTNLALDYFNSAYKLSEKNNMYSNLEYLSYAIAKIYEKAGRMEPFRDMIKLHLVYKDSNAKFNKIQQITRQQLEFDYERKQIADSVKFEQKEKLKNAELKVAATELAEAKSLRAMLLIILIIIVVFSIFISNRFLIIRKQNKIIERQKKLVEVKNQEITDSINYAKRLQYAILPQIEDIKKVLNFDLLYLPKDIIGGDFYFFANHGNITVIAICDCTGHGIPGAMMSVVCHHALQKSIVEFNLSEPGIILENTRKIIIESLNAAQQNIKDGMDCSLLVINKLNNEVSWAGANNPLWILHENELIEIKADKQPVAFYENAVSFTNHNLQVKPGSRLYLFTDGYTDQFGGPKGKKYKTKTLKKYLLTLENDEVSNQIAKIGENFIHWKGQHDQIDDVTIALIKL